MIRVCKLYCVRMSMHLHVDVLASHRTCTNVHVGTCTPDTTLHLVGIRLVEWLLHVLRYVNSHVMNGHGVCQGGVVHGHTLENYDVACMT